MKTDLYTKIVLTAIAAGIFILIFQNAGLTPVTTAHAAAAPIPAPAPHERQVIDVNLVQVNGMDLYQRWVNLKDGNKAGYIPISLESVDETTSTFNVNIKDIDRQFVTSSSFYTNTKSLNVSITDK